jgi:hypothetical protein
VTKDRRENVFILFSLSVTTLIAPAGGNPMLFAEDNHHFVQCSSICQVDD